MTTRTSEVLNKAADLIEKRGWTTGPEGWLHDTEYDGKLCLEGGLMAALDVGTPHEILECPAYQAVQDYLGFRGSRLYIWNDGRGTSETVIETLRAAAVIEEAKEEAEVLEEVAA